MKSNLSAATASSRQDPQFVSDLKFKETPLQLGSPSAIEIERELPPLLQTGDPIPVEVPAGLRIDALSVVAGDGTEKEIATAGFKQTGDESVEPNSDSSTVASTSSNEKSVETQATLATESRTPEPESFVGLYWPYLLLAAMLVCWVISQLFSRRDPSFKRQSRKPPKKNASTVVDNPRGQFKKAERFLKPKEKGPPEEQEPSEASEVVGASSPPTVTVVEETVPAEPDLLEDKDQSTKQERVKTMPTDQPADDEFDFGLSDGGADSDVFNLDDVAEISEAVDGSESESSSKRFKTEDDVEVSLPSGDSDVDDDEFVAFDDQDSQLSLADSDAEFGFDLDDEEPNHLLDSGKKVSEALVENVDPAGESLGERGLSDVVDEVKDAASGGIEGAQAGMVAAVGTAAAGVAAAGAAAKKGGFFSRLFGGKKKKKGNDDPIDGLVQEGEVGEVDMQGVTSGVPGQVDQFADEVPGLVDDSRGLDDDSDELMFDLEDSDEEVPVGDLAALDDDLAVEALPAVESDSAEVEEVVADLDGNDSGELSFDLDGSDEEVAASSMETLVDEPVVESLPAAKAEVVSAEGVVAGVEGSDSGEFGFGLFEDEDAGETEPVDLSLENSDDDSESGVSAPVVAAATAAVGAGLAGIGLAGSGSADTEASDRQWKAKLSAVEDQNSQLSSQVTSLTKELEEAKKSSAQAESLKEEHGVLAETVKSLGLEKDELLEEKELVDKEKSRLAEELEAAEKKSSTWEQEKADLLKQQEELKAEKEALDSELESLTTKSDESATELSALQDEVAAFAEKRSEFESEIETLKAKLAEVEAKPVESEASEDIEDLRDRFKRRLASEHRKRKQAERLVEEAESQRNDVAKLLRAAKAELKELKS